MKKGRKLMATILIFLQMLSYNISEKRILPTFEKLWNCLLFLLCYNWRLLYLSFTDRFSLVFCFCISLLIRLSLESQTISNSVLEYSILLLHSFLSFLLSFFQIILFLFLFLGKGGLRTSSIYWSIHGYFETCLYIFSLKIFHCFFLHLKLIFIDFFGLFIKVVHACCKKFWKIEKLRRKQIISNPTTHIQPLLMLWCFFPAYSLSHSVIYAERYCCVLVKSGHSRARLLGLSSGYVTYQLGFWRNHLISFVP